MLALYRAGRQSAALDTFNVHRRRLVEELGLEPGPELRSLQTAILRQDPSLLPAAANGGVARWLPRRRLLSRGRAGAAVALVGAAALAITLVGHTGADDDGPTTALRADSVVAIDAAR